MIPDPDPNEHGNYSPRNTSIDVTRLATECGTFFTFLFLVFENYAATVDRVIEISSVRGSGSS